MKRLTKYRSQSIIIGYNDMVKHQMTTIFKEYSIKLHSIESNPGLMRRKWKFQKHIRLKTLISKALDHGTQKLVLVQTISKPPAGEPAAMRYIR